MRGLDFADYKHDRIVIGTEKDHFRHFIIIWLDKENAYSICLNTQQMLELKENLNKDFKFKKTKDGIKWGDY